MKSQNNPPLLSHIENTSLSTWLEEATKTSKVKRIFIATSGYEKRSAHWMSGIIKRFPSSSSNTYLVIGFKDYPDALSRHENDAFYDSYGLTRESIDSEEKDAIIVFVEKQVYEIIKNTQEEKIEVHIDYSCMPRLWYCQLPVLLDRLLRPEDAAYFWYTPGEYPEAEFPTAGVEDFNVFSGKPSLSAYFRIHFLGLGFDRIRSQAIWSVLDPQHLICFYADPAVKFEYVKRVEDDNRDVLSIANHIFTVPVHDFVYTYSKIASAVSEFRTLGDVILVPDGPKPLILAASFVPLRLQKPGVLCFHVTRHKTPDFQPIDVKPLGEPFGFRFCGRVDSLPK